MNPAAFPRGAARMRAVAVILFAMVTACATVAVRTSDASDVVWSPAEQPLADEVGGLRNLPDDARGAAIRSLAGRIQGLAPSLNRLRLAVWLESVSTEGDFGESTLREVAAMLIATLRTSTAPPGRSQVALPPVAADDPLVERGYRALASLARYEHVPVAMADDTRYQNTLARLASVDEQRERADFTLKDLGGAEWTLTALRGKVVLVNFWATWCPPCRKEIPDLDALYRKYAPAGLVVLGITDEDADKVAPFVQRQSISYPVLLDVQKAANRRLMTEGIIPKSFVFDRKGRLVAAAMDMRTQAQFVAMLHAAGL